MELFAGHKIRVASSPIHGLGVFASQDISAGELIEECSFLELPIENGESSSLLIDYRFNYPSGPMTPLTKQVVVLGSGSLYNHSDNADAYWVTDSRSKTFKFFASRDILAGEEIFTYYGDSSYWADGRGSTEITENNGSKK